MRYMPNHVTDVYKLLKERTGNRKGCIGSHVGKKKGGGGFINRGLTTVKGGRKIKKRVQRKRRGGKSSTDNKVLCSPIRERSGDERGRTKGEEEVGGQYFFRARLLSSRYSGLRRRKHIRGMEG